MQKNRVFAVVGPLLTVAAVVGSFVYGGLGAVALALAVAGSAVAAAKRSLNQHYQGNLKFVGDAIDVIVQKGKGKSKGLTGGKHSDSVTVVMTPGSHRLSVRWFGKMVATSRYGAANSLGSFLNYQVNIAPVNDENWPRFTGPDVEVIGSGSVLSGSNDYPVSLTGSELDVLVVYPEARVPDLIPAKAKSVYAEPRPFPEPWPEYRLDEPPIIDLVAVAQLDEYGRRSVLLAGNQRAVVWTNRIGGFRGRTTYVEELGNQRARGIVAADLNGDQWRHVFFAFDQQVIAIGPIKPEPIDNQLLTALSSHLFSSGGSVMGLAGVSDMPLA